MKIKVKHILVILIIVILAIVGITIIYKIKNKNTEINETEVIEIKDEKIKLEQFEDSHVLILDLVRKNGDWSKLPVTQKFRGKYNERDGILGDIQFDNVEYKPYKDGEYYFTEAPYFVITQGKVQTAYIFNWNTSLEGIDDIALAYTVQLTDENGNKLDERQIVTEENFNSLMRDIAFGPPDDEGVGVTPHFHKKYPYFLDLFIHYSPLDFNEIYFDENKSSWEKKEAYFEVDSTLECIKRHYLVKFTLDDKGYLDDADVKCVGEYPYEADKKNEQYKLIYKNSNWDKLNLTDNFRKKFTPNNGIFPDIDKFPINRFTDRKYNSSSQKLDDDWYIDCYHLVDDHYYYYKRKYVRTVDGYLDDVLWEKLEYVDMDSEEVKEAYLKDYSQN